MTNFDSIVKDDGFRFDASGSAHYVEVAETITWLVYRP